ncbi:MAG TPA: glycoside hydrolase family 3 C-terminal domain-containing protein [Opitutaceae bacterium]|nr:glycoside hydrolase family 3 C-terminal domain-containing protein [Opitutaceae bacterium]
MPLPKLTFVTVGLVLLAATALAAGSPPPYLDPSQPIETRVHDLVSRMTLDEKAAEMMNTTPGVPRLGIPKYDWWNEALHGVARAGDATVFPQAIAMAAMWDEPLMHQIAGIIGTEARAKYNGAGAHAGQRYYGLTFWSPNINIFRDPRWGRGQETYGEDPFLTSRLGVAFVRGLQGDDPHYLQAAACAKHFAVHSGPEPLRHIFNAQPPEADLYETYLPAFEALVREAHVEAVMTAYNSLYGKPCAVNPLLYGLLDRWGFDGHVTSDCGAIADLSRTYHIARDDAEAEAISIKAGLCVRCGDNPPMLAEAVRRGLISEAVVDRQLGKLLRTMFRLGFFDPPSMVPYSRIAPAKNNTPQHAAVARRAADEAMVLLKNDGTLPLDPARLHRIAVIGPNASSDEVLVGNYNGHPSAPVSVLAGLKAALGSGVEVDYVRGCDYADQPTGMRDIPRTALQSEGYTGLVGDYFPNRDLRGEPVAHHRDRPIDLDFSARPVPAGLPAQNMSVRWQGRLLTTLGGDYTLAVKANGGVRLIVGGETLIDAWTPGEKTRTITRHLSENANLPITLEYFQGDGPVRVALQWQTPDPLLEMKPAVAAAAKADAIVFVGGISAQLEGEEMKVDYEGFDGGDRTRIELPALQQKLLRELKATGRPLVCVFLSGSALAVPWADAHANAILEAWYPGQAGGTAVADVLLGKFNPAGRLPVTFYRATSDLPPFAEYRMANRTYRYFTGKPLYAFGHGLSYTKFEYSGARVSVGSGGTPQLVVNVDVANVGARDGDEVVQVYLKPPHAREREALGGFARIAIARGEKKSVQLIVPEFALRRWNTETHAYEIPAGEWQVRIGAASDDIRQTVAVKL